MPQVKTGSARYRALPLMEQMLAGTLAIRVIAETRDQIRPQQVEPELNDDPAALLPVR